MQDKAEFLYGADSILETEDMTTFLCEHYKVREYIPKEILLSFKIDDGERELVSSYLTSLGGRRVSLRTPEPGDMKTLSDMARDNAMEKAKNIVRILSSPWDCLWIPTEYLLLLISFPEIRMNRQH
mgnify:CR=1 FL=1